MTEQDGVSPSARHRVPGCAPSRDEEQQLRRFSKSIIIKDALARAVAGRSHAVPAPGGVRTVGRAPPDAAGGAATAKLPWKAATLLVVEDDVRNVSRPSILEPTGIRAEDCAQRPEALQALSVPVAAASPPSTWC